MVKNRYSDLPLPVLLLLMLVIWLIASLMSDGVMETIINFIGILIAGALGRWTVHKLSNYRERRNLP